MVEELRKCNSCGEYRLIDDFYVYSGSARKSGIRGTCKYCTREWHRHRVIAAPKTPDGGWTVEALQEHYDSLGFDITVLAIGKAKDFLEAGVGPSFAGKKAYVQNNKTGERLVVPINKRHLTSHPGKRYESHIETMKKVIKKLREFDKGLGILSTDAFYKSSNEHGDVLYLKIGEPLKDGYTYIQDLKYVHLINHRTGQTGYFTISGILFGRAPWGNGGYSPERPGVFYLIMVDDMVIKFGITNNMVDVRYSGEYLDFNKYVTILEVKFEDGTIPQKMERKVGHMVKDHRYNGPKVFRVTKNTECFWYGDGIKLCEVLEYVKSVKDKEGGEVITWANTVTSKEQKKTSTQQSTPMQLSLGL